MADFEDALNFDPATVEDATWDPLPDGEYTAQVIQAEKGQPRSLDGQHVAVVWKVLDGEYTNREVRDWIALTSSNAQRQKIGQQMLKQMCGAMGLAFAKSVQDFCFKPVTIVVGTKKDQNGEDRNRIKRVKPINGAVATPATPKAVPSVSAIAAGTATSKPTGTAPWSR